MSQESFRSYSCSVKPILALQWVPVFCVAKADESETTLAVLNQSPDFRWSLYCMCRGIRMLRDKRMSCPPHPLLGWTCGWSALAADLKPENRNPRFENARHVRLAH